MMGLKLNIRFRHTIVSVICWIYTLLFTYAGMSKLLDFQNFKIQLGQSPMLTSFAEIIAYGIPVLELLLAIALAINRLRTVALYASLGLMVCFSMYIAVILNFSDYIPCSCGGILERMGWTEHLIFNLIFVVIGSIALVLDSQYHGEFSNIDLTSNKTGFKSNQHKKPALIKISIVLLVCSGFVLGLFFYTDYKNHLPGSFIRLFPPHPISEIKARIFLTKNQFQFAGINKNYIYLHKKGNPLELFQLNYNLSKVDTIILKVPTDLLNLSRTTIAINDLGVFITDGTVPILLKGNTRNWKLKALDLKDNYFNAVAIIDTNLLAVIKLIPKKGRFLGMLNTNTLTTQLNPLALEKQVDGFFCTDGYMHYNPELQKLIYSYYYRNEYLIMNKDLRVTARYRTLDTTTIAKIKIKVAKKNGPRSLATPPPIVNRRSFSQDHWLFNQSKTRAKNESEAKYKKGSVIDVYNLITGAYTLSFYISHIQGQAFKDFRVKNSQLFVLYSDQLVRLDLINNYLSLSVSKSERHKDILHVEPGM